MLRNRLRVAALALSLVLSVPAQSAACRLSMTLDCPDPLAGQGLCRSVTRNDGTTSCTGFFASGFVVRSSASGARLSGLSTDGEFLRSCWDSHYYAHPEPDGPGGWCSSAATLAPGQSFSATVTVIGAGFPIPLEAFTFVSETEGKIIASATAARTLRPAGCTPELAVPGGAPSGISYEVRWSSVGSGVEYELQEAAEPSFAAPVTRRTSTLAATFSHTVSVGTPWYYRVRAVQCSDGSAPIYSPAERVVVSPPVTPTAPRFDLTTPVGTTAELRQDVSVAAPSGARTFTASFDQPWVTVSPASGNVVDGRAAITLRFSPSSLPVGASAGTLAVAFQAGGTKKETTPSSSLPVTLTLVTPVTSGGKSAPSSDTLIIPSVTHVEGAAPFRSDVRIANANDREIEYTIAFTPWNADGKVNGKKTMVRLRPGQTVAMDDVLRNFFGYAAPGDAIAGALDIRPHGASAPLTFASSRTYAIGPSGTLGQFIPALPVTGFLGASFLWPGQAGSAQVGVPLASLQQVAQNLSYRTNLGLIEGAGIASTGLIRIFDGAGTFLRQDPFSLRPAEMIQLNKYLEGKVPPMADGRIEILLEAGGIVSGYASVIDNGTNDPMLVTATVPSKIRSRRYVLPGMAELTNPLANFRSDVRLYNGAVGTIPVTIRYFPQPGSPGTGATSSLTLGPGEVKALDRVLPALFGVSESGGAIVLDTPTDTSLVVTGRTYSQTAGGTYGQFIPALTSSEGAAAGDRPLEILQVEESPAYRTNLGLVELSGQPVTVRVSASIPGSLSSPFVDVSLAPNQFVQYGRLLATALNVPVGYNVRLSIQATGGQGKVAAYASVIDNRTQDPTYVPAQ